MYQWVKNKIELYVDYKKPTLFLFIYFLKDFIYLFDRDRDSQREREHKQGEWQAEGEGEAGSQLSREPDVGLHPRMLES